ncbi:MAG: hypothetical protein V1932_01910, partial [Chloroflexota bacterium]
PTVATGPPVTWAQMVGGEIMGWDYMREFVKQEPTIVADARLLVDWVAHGKYPIAVGTKVEVVLEFVKVGAPVAVIIVAGDGSYLNVGSGTVSLFKNAPHPNASKVYVNWLLITYCNQDGSEV